MPTLIHQLELTGPVSPIQAADQYDAIYLYLKWQGQIIDLVIINNDRRPVGPQQIITTIVKATHDTILTRLYREHNPEVSPDRRAGLAADLERALTHRLTLALPAETVLEGTARGKVVAQQDLTVSIIICTLDRPQDLVNCLERLSRHQTGLRYEVVVVDNNPASGLTRPIAAEYGVRYVAEPRRGVSYARNAGIKAMRGRILVYLDDDVTVAEGWLDRLIEPFEDKTVMCVTGLVLPKDLNNYSAELFEDYGGLGRGFKPIKYDQSFLQRRLRSAPTWEIGGTASAAFRGTIFKDVRIGPFREDLGPGVPSGVGEDTYMFYKILKAGYSCFYQPGSVAYHSHRQDMAALRKQLFNYSKGHVAYHLVTLFNDKDWLTLPYLLIYLPRMLWWRFRQTRKKYSFYPVKLLLLESWGYLNGPWSLYRSIKQANKLGRTTAQDIELAWCDRIPL